MRVKEILFLVIISVIYLAINTYNLDSWYYSAIGDEYAFFETARNIALGQVKLSLLPSLEHLALLDQRGVYGVVPVAISAYQALVMKFVGINHRGWLLSSILSILLSFWPFYFGTKEIFGQKTAIFSTLIFSFSHYLWAFSHTGYWNILAIFPATLAFYLFAQALKKNKLILWFALGVVSGLAFWVHYYPGIAVVLVSLFFLFYRKYSRIFTFFFGFLIAFIPYFYINQGVFFETISARTLVASQEIQQGQRLFYFFKNLSSSFLAFFHSSATSHYTSGSLLDPISGLLFLLGLVLMLIDWKRFAFLLLTLFLVLVMLGGFSQYAYTPISRIYFALPLTALIAGYGLEKLLKVLKSRLSSNVSFLATGLVLISVLAFNLGRFFYQTPRSLQATREAVAIKALREVCFNQKTAIIDKGPKAFLQPAISSYQLRNSPHLFPTDEVVVNDLSGYDCLILTESSSPQMVSLKQKIEKSLPLYNKSTVSDFTGKSTVFVYH